LLVIRRVDLFCGSGGLVERVEFKFSHADFGQITAVWSEGEAMSDECQSEVGKVLRNARQLKDAFGKYLGALVLVFALWTVRKRAGLLTALLSVTALLITGWLKLWA
jgi:hypothetical protein